MSRVHVRWTCAADAADGAPAPGTGGCVGSGRTPRWHGPRRGIGIRMAHPDATRTSSRGGGTGGGHGGEQSNSSVSVVVYRKVYRRGRPADRAPRNREKECTVVYPRRLRPRSIPYFIHLDFHPYRPPHANVAVT